MNLYLDDQPVVVDDAEELTVKQVVERVSGRWLDKDRLLVSIRCNGDAVDSDRLDEVLALGAAEFETLEFQSCNVRELVRSVLEAAEKSFADTDRQRREAADLLSEGQTAQAMSVLTVCFQTWAQVHSAVIQSANSLSLDLTALPVGDGTASIWLNGLAERLRALKEALEAGDHVSVADILRYEFDEVSGQWRGLLTVLLGRVDAA